MISFQPVERISDFNGSLSWQKFSDPREKRYPAGFLITDQQIVGSVYKMPFPGEAILSPIVTGDTNNATWEIGEGNLSDPIATDLTWNGKNKVTAEGLSADESLRISATVRTGLVRGSYRDKSTGSKVNFAGVAFQKQDIIAGNFSGDTESGFVVIRPSGLGELTVYDDTDTPIDAGDTVARGDVGTDGGVDNSRFKITNQGTGNLQVHAIESDQPDIFAIINGGPALVAPGESAFFWTRFAPQTQSTFGTSVSISSDAGDLSFDVTGAGVPGSADGASSDSYDSWNGTKLSHSGFVSVDGEWLFYKDLYRSKPKGLLAGRLLFRDEAGLSDFDGELQWLKHEDSREKRFKRGFNLRQVALGSMYNPPERGARAFTTLDASLGHFIFRSSEGDIPPPSPLRGEWGTNNRVTYTSEARERLTVKVNSKTGIVTGNYNDPAQKHRVSFGGAIFSKQGLLSGHFIGIYQTGVIDISADPGE